ncbi:MAG: response regulator [Candidatus Moranbacteria bacterium]|nr:response regulator [Candidatus Moranbacteria bacterium]
MPKILFVEDDPFIAEIYKKKFESSGFDVLNVVTGKAVLKEALEQKFDLILLDLVIPELSGVEVLRELRHNPAYDPNLKVVVFSNLSSTEDREECLKLGANGFISKTEFSPKEVVVEINRFLNQFSEQKKNFSRQEKAPAQQVKLGKRILLIEDEEVFVEMFGKRLRDEGYEVVTEMNGTAGLDTAVKEHFDMIISDVMMPGMEGSEAIRRLKEIEGKESVPIFFFSASLDDQHLKALTDSGLGDRTFLKTQITPSELTYAVNDFFKERK